jgi:GntR family transcriptional regulator, transcriptional repressor for pyruvate dehydrogenase complex
MSTDTTKQEAVVGEATSVAVAYTDHVKSSLSDRVYEQLLALISSGDYAQDRKLPGEIELTRRFGVSRPVLRKALARLRLDGVLESRQGAGNFVRQRTDNGVISYGPLQNIPDVHCCLEFRCGLESEAAARAAIERDDANLKDIARAMRALEQALLASEQVVEADFAFHAEVARATKNRFFLATLEALRPQILFSINLIRSLSTRPLHMRASDIAAEHIRIYEAIRDSDPERAKAAIAAHIGNGIKRLFGQS